MGRLADDVPANGSDDHANTLLFVEHTTLYIRIYGVHLDVHTRCRLSLRSIRHHSSAASDCNPHNDRRKGLISITF